MSWLSLIHAKLVADNVATGACPCTIGYQPDSPDASIVLTYTGGAPQDTHGGENIPANFQLRVRGSRLDYQFVEDTCRAAFNSLDNANITGFNLILADSASPLIFTDGKERPIGSLNFRTVRANV